MTRPPFRAVHQLVSNFDVGDAIGNHVRALRRLLRSWGYASDVYAQYRHMSLLKDSHFYTTYRAVSSPDTAGPLPLLDRLGGHQLLREPPGPARHGLPQHHAARVLRRASTRGSPIAAGAGAGSSRGCGTSPSLRSASRSSTGRSSRARAFGAPACCRSWSTGTQYAHPRVPALEEAYGRGTNLLFVGRARPEQARRGPDQGLLLLPAARSGEPADHRRARRWTPRPTSPAARSSAPSWVSSTTWCSRAASRRRSSAPTTASRRRTSASPSTRASACRSSRRCTSRCR